MTAPTEPLKLWVCLCCGETWKDTADLTPTWGGYGHVVSPEDLCGEVVEYAPVAARDPAAELRAALVAICEGAPEEEPDWYEGDNHGDTAGQAAEREHYRLAQIARAALAATEGQS